MYIMNERSGAIINSKFVTEFYLAKTSEEICAVVEESK